MDYTEQMPEGMTVGFDMPVVTSAVTEKYVYFSVEKVWSDIRKRIVADDFKSGATLTPPFSEQVLIAFVRPGKGLVKEEQRKDSITLDELTMMMTDYLRFLETIQTLNSK